MRVHIFFIIFSIVVTGLVVTTISAGLQSGELNRYIGKPVNTFIRMMTKRLAQQLNPSPSPQSEIKTSSPSPTDTFTQDTHVSSQTVYSVDGKTTVIINGKQVYPPVEKE